MNKNSIITILLMTMAISALLLSNPYLPQANGTEKGKPFANLKGYGERRSVTTHEKARKIFKEHLSDRDVVIGEIIAEQLFFRTEIRGKDGALIDKIIIDKRTGRIRSIY